MRARPALALAVLPALLAGGAAVAAPTPKPVCNLIKDAAGDGTATLLVDGGPNEDAWDIVSADVASSGSKLTTVIRVAALAESATTSPGGVQWRFNFSVGDAQLYTQVTADALLGTSASYGYVDTISNTLGDAGFVLDTKKNEVRVTVPLSGFSEQAKIAKVGTALTELDATAGRYYNLGAVTASEASDSAPGTGRYKTGTTSCVVVGK